MNLNIKSYLHIQKNHIICRWDICSTLFQVYNTIYYSNISMIRKDNWYIVILAQKSIPKQILMHLTNEEIMNRMNNGLFATLKFNNFSLQISRRYRLFQYICCIRGKWIDKILLDCSCINKYRCISNSYTLFCKYSLFKMHYRHFSYQYRQPFI